MPGAEVAPGADVAALARSDPHTRARAMGALQRGAGNAAISRALRPTIARAITADQADTIADTVFEAVDGIGTDEDAIYKAMKPVTVTATEIPQLMIAYSNRHKGRSFLGHSEGRPLRRQHPGPSPHRPVCDRFLPF